jgi:hypothetical protein
MINARPKSPAAAFPVRRRLGLWRFPFALRPLEKVHDTLSVFLFCLVLRRVDVHDKTCWATDFKRRMITRVFRFCATLLSLPCPKKAHADQALPGRGGLIDDRARTRAPSGES